MGLCASKDSRESSSHDSHQTRPNTRNLAAGQGQGRGEGQGSHPVEKKKARSNSSSGKTKASTAASDDATGNASQRASSQKTSPKGSPQENGKEENGDGSAGEESDRMTGLSQALALNGSTTVGRQNNDSAVTRNGRSSNAMVSQGSTGTQQAQQPSQNSNTNQGVERAAGQVSDSANTLKVLLLGSGESGKSTVLQQLKILHQNGFSKEELLEYRPFIFDNVIETGKDLAKARRMFNVELEQDAPITEKDIDNLLGLQIQTTKLTSLPRDLTATLKTLWNLPSSQELLVSEHRSSFYLMDSAGYFYDNLDRISQPNYVPIITDVIRTRKKTSGIFDTVIDLDKNLRLHFYDVGGQRSERKKWIHCFDNVTLVIFCVSLSEYDQTLLEDNSQNRLEESLILFDSVVNSRWFARSSIVLFLNKIDIFADKIRHVPLERYFPDYTGGKDINKAAKYILWRFVQLNRANLNIYPHVTQATDTSNIKLVFAAIKETILENNLKDSGVL